MQPKSRKLVERIRSSRARPPLDRSHFAALADDVVAMGKHAFLEEIDRLLAPKPAKSRSAPAHPLEEFFLAARERTRFSTRRQFVDAVVRRAVQEKGESFALPSRSRSMPRLLEDYSARMSEAELKALLRAVSDQNRHARQA